MREAAWIPIILFLILVIGVLLKIHLSTWNDKLYNMLQEFEEKKKRILIDYFSEGTSFQNEYVGYCELRKMAEEYVNRYKKATKFFPEIFISKEVKSQYENLYYWDREIFERK